MLLMNVVATAEMVVFKGIVAKVVEMVEMVDVMLLSTLPTVVFATKLVRLVTSVAIVVVATVAMVDRGVVARVIGTIIVDNVVAVLVVDVNWVVGSNVLGVVVCSVDAIVLMVAIVVFMGVSVGANGNFGQFSSRFGPSILSNT